MQRFLQENPEYREQPIVFSAKRGRSEEVIACSPRAKQLGITTDMRTPDAEALVPRHRLQVFPHRPLNDRRALEQLASECQRFSPLVALENAAEPSALMLEVNGIAPLWGKTQTEGERQVLQAVDEWSDEKRLSLHVAIARTPGLAWAAAHFLDWLPQVGNDRRIIANEDSQKISDRLPVEALRINAHLVVLLHSLGIESIGQLRALPRASLLSRFGPQLGWRLDQLQGEAPEPLTFCESTQPLVARWPFETAVASGEVLASVLDRLLERLAVSLKDRQRGALRVRIVYGLEVSRSRPSSLSIELRLFRPTACPQELAELAALQLSQVHFPTAVQSITAYTTATAPLEIRQKNLFDDQSRQDSHELALLVNRLASRVGNSRVSRLEKQASHDPRRSFRYLPATEFEAKPYRLTALQVDHLRRLPLALYEDQSQPVQVKMLSDNTPAAILHQSWQEVVHCWGPERVETGWWRGRGWRRDAYWIELTDGGWLWLNFDRRTRQWQLAGEFF